MKGVGNIPKVTLNLWKRASTKVVHHKKALSFIVEEGSITVGSEAVGNL